MIILGIDVGKTGECCAMLPDGPVFFGPCAEGLIKAVSIIGSDVHVFLEAQNAFPGQGVSSCFRFGQSYGELIGVLKAFRIPYTCVHPRTWTKEMLQGVPTRFEGKQRAAFRAAQLFPGIDLKDSSRCKKPSEGKCDALLIAEYGRRQMSR